MKANVKDLSILVIEKESLDLYLDFMTLIKSTTEHPEYLGDFTRDDLLYILENKGSIFLFKLGNVIVSTCMLIPTTKEQLKKYGLKLDYKKTIALGPQAVFEDLRGNGIQKYMIEKMEILSKDLGYDHMVFTVDPNNKASVNNIEQEGYQKVGTKEFTRSIRNIYYKDI